MSVELPEIFLTPPPAILAGIPCGVLTTIAKAINIFTIRVVEIGFLDAHAAGS
jgi:hypothetical protein